MILFDTNVLIYGFDRHSVLHGWARETIADAVSSDGGAINVVSLAEICVGDADPGSVAERIRRWDVDILDLPVAVAETCARAYQAYRLRRHSQSGHDSRCPISSSAPMPRSWDGRWRPPIPAASQRTSPAWY